MAVVVFCLLVGFTLGLSFWLGAKAKSAQGYFAAGGHIPWFVNGVAFAGDYLSAASFLGICGMIAFSGFDGFLYSIGYLAGWIVALLVVAEPLKRMGKFTFADAIDARFNSKTLRGVAALSTLVVSLVYLIPQMVGAGVLVQPLLGWPHWIGVCLVGAVVVVIVATAGMVSTTWVQFIKGALLVVFTGLLVVLILGRGMTEKPLTVEVKDATHATVSAAQLGLPESAVKLPEEAGWKDKVYVRFKTAEGEVKAWRYQDGKQWPDMMLEFPNPATLPDLCKLLPCQLLTQSGDKTLINGLPKSETNTLQPVGSVEKLPFARGAADSHTPTGFLSTLRDSRIASWTSEKIKEADGSTTTVYYPVIKPGSDLLTPGNNKAFAGLRGEDLKPKINILSLMLALLLGTASLPHILIRYYTVKDAASARKSTIVGIASIGVFYVLTLFLGLGAMVSGALDPADSNMAAPLLARAFSPLLFAIISAIAFTTVLGTVSGLIIAASGAVAHDLAAGMLGMQLSDQKKVRLARVASLGVGALAIVLGILFQKLNVNYLVGWAFAVAASANLPALLMCLFWKRATRAGVISAMAVGLVSSVGWILLSEDMFTSVYKLDAKHALAPFGQPGIVTIPLALVVGVVVSLLGKPKVAAEQDVEQAAAKSA